MYKNQLLIKTTLSKLKITYFDYYKKQLRAPLRANNAFRRSL